MAHAWADKQQDWQSLGIRLSFPLVAFFIKKLHIIVAKYITA